MGWMTLWERKLVAQLYGVLAEYRCDYCRQPMPIGSVPVVDPKGGYFPRPKDTPVFVAQHPKKTYHNHPCNDLRLGKKPLYEEDIEKIQEEKLSLEQIHKVADRILKKITKARRGSAFTLPMLFKKFPKVKRKLVKRAIGNLRRRKLVAKRGKFIVLGEKKRSVK